MLRELASAVGDVYEQLDATVARFAGCNSFGCPPGCGTCCQSEKVEATVLEMLPLAFHLFESHQAELLLKRLEAIGTIKQCILYRFDWSQDGKWGCSQYQHRAVVCRLFGYAGNRGKDGARRFALCRHMKPDVASGGSLVDRQLRGADFDLAEMPLFAEAGMAITALHPGMGTDRKPINEALMAALFKVGMYLDYSAPAVTASTQPELPPEKPLAPLGGRRKRAA